MLGPKVLGRGVQVPGESAAQLMEADVGGSEARGAGRRGGASEGGAQAMRRGLGTLAGLTTLGHREAILSSAIEEATDQG